MGSIQGRTNPATCHPKRANKSKGLCWKCLSKEQSWKRQGIKLTLVEYEALLDAQESLCAICEDWPSKGKRFAVDHDHETGKVRGLLCWQCNYYLVRSRHTAKLLRVAADYLEGHKRKIPQRVPAPWQDGSWK